MPNHITTELIASPEVIEAFTRTLTPQEIAAERTDYEETLERIKKRGSDYELPVPDYERKFVDFALIIPTPPNDGVHEDGTVCWYNWNVDHWGTKWNAYSNEWEDLDDGRVKLRFDTAWAHPEPVIKALSEKFPSETIEIRYADEDLGSNCGTYEIKAGVLTVADFPDGEAALELACDVKYGVPYEEKRREWEEDEAEWEFKHSVYDRFQEEAGLPDRPRPRYDASMTSEERAAEQAEVKKWDEAYREVMRKGDEYIKNLEEAEVRSAIDSILAARNSDE